MSLSDQFPQPPHRPISEETFETFIDACVEGETAIMEMLLESHPDIVDKADAQGWTPLHHAASWAQEEAVALLIARGAHNDLVDGTGATAGELAVRQGFGKLTDDIVRQTEERDARRRAEERHAALEENVARCHKGIDTDISVRAKPLRLRK